ncbi:response regulator [Pontibacter pamirensis]|uniref:response regulator n=1 Tax=Pontibacter pamirensis TaxID=2562824 RepID=UPI001389B7B4|nr:response regulator [Pontibacter pamirensis]
MTGTEESKIKKILLVDDDPTVAFLTQRLLKQAAAEADVQLAKNGREALDILREVYLRKQCHVLILLDINMPVMDGFEFLEEFQESANLSTAAISIVLLSSSAHHLDMAKARNYPTIGYIQKPLTLDKLLEFL